MNIYVSKDQYNQVQDLLSKKIGLDINLTDWTLQLQNLLGVKLAESLLRRPGTHHLVLEGTTTSDKVPVRIPTEEERVLAAYIIQLRSALADLLADPTDELTRKYAEYLTERFSYV
jgi:hypothetical protein